MNEVEMDMFEYVVVDKLPERGEPDKTYLIETNGTYEEYVFIGEKYNCIGQVNVDVDGGEDSYDLLYTNCPNCGAPVNKYADACPYCETPYIKNGGIYAR